MASEKALHPVFKNLWATVLSSCAVAALTALIGALHIDAGAANVSMLYLFIVILSALYLGRFAAVWASFLSFLSLNWFFVSPRYTFAVHNSAEWITLCVFLFTAMVTGQLMARLKARAIESQVRQSEATALAEASWAVASKLDTKSALTEVLSRVSRVLQLELAAVYTLDEQGNLQLAIIHREPVPPDRPDHAIPRTDEQLTELLSVVKSGEPGQRERLLTVLMDGHMLGTIFVRSAEENLNWNEHKRILDSLINHTAVILQRDDLIKSQTMATALADADKMKTALLSMISHDFRSPLTSIKASVSTLLSEGRPLDSETQRSLYQTIEQETDRLNLMVGNILDLSRLESNAWRPKLEMTSVAELIGMTLDAFNEESNQRIVVRLDEHLTDVYVDPVQMAQVLKNLIENALKYSQATVEIETGLDSDSHPYLQVLDSGSGLPPGESARLFQRFFRAPELQESSTPGIGIGLAVCKGLVEVHGGQLQASNRAGGGACFRVTLTRNDSDRDSNAHTSD